MVLVRTLYAVILLQIVLDLVRLVSYLLHVTQELVPGQSSGVASRFARVASGSDRGATQLPPVSPRTGQAYGYSRGVSGRFARVADDPGFGADRSSPDASHSGCDRDRPSSVAAGTGCVTGDPGCVSCHPGFVSGDSGGVADWTGAVAGHPGRVSYPSRRVADRCRAVTRASGTKTDDLVVHTDDLGVVTADSTLPPVPSGVLAADSSFTTDDVVMRKSPAGLLLDRAAGQAGRSPCPSREAAPHAAHVEQTPGHLRVQLAGVGVLPSDVPSPYDG